MYKKIAKRLTDLCVAVCGIAVLLPAMIILVSVISISNGGPVLFRQVRPGRYDRLFTVLKFKTMNDGLDAAGNLLPDRQRVTRIGRFMRVLSLDELPQLWNVIKGEMSLVGPRPLLPEYLPLYNEHQARRHEVRPGMTGWAQVNGRNAISWEEKFDMDVWYVDNLSFCLDVKILFMTLLKVIRREGINSDTAATMEKFTGNG